MSHIEKKFAHKWRNKVKYKKGKIGKLERDRSYHETLLEAVVREAQHQQKKKEEDMKKETDQLKQLLDAQDMHIKRQQDAMNKILALLDSQNQSEMPNTKRAATLDSSSYVSNPQSPLNNNPSLPLPPKSKQSEHQRNRSPLRHRLIRSVSAGEMNKGTNNSEKCHNENILDSNTNNVNTNNTIHDRTNNVLSSNLSNESINQKKFNRSNSIVSQNDSQISVSTTATAPGVDDVHPTIEGIRLCQNCEEHVAIILCEDCNLFLCVKGHCDEVLHRSKVKRTHNRRPMFGAALVATKESRRILIGGSTESNESKESNQSNELCTNTLSESDDKSFSTQTSSRRSSTRSIVPPLPRPNSILNYSVVNTNDSDSEISDIESDDDQTISKPMINSKSTKPGHRVRRSRTMTSIVEQLKNEKQQHKRELSYLPSSYKATGRIGIRMRARPWRSTNSAITPVSKQPTPPMGRRRSISQPPTARMKRILSKDKTTKIISSPYKGSFSPHKEKRVQKQRGKKKSIFHLPPLPVPSQKGKLSND